jgi:hypothetical protein
MLTWQTCEDAAVLSAGTRTSIQFHAPSFCPTLSARALLPVCVFCCRCHCLLHGSLLSMHSANGEGLKLKLDGSSSRFCDAGALVASVVSLMAADVVTETVWSESVNEDVYTECQHFNSKMRANRRQMLNGAASGSSGPTGPESGVNM